MRDRGREGHCITWSPLRWFWLLGAAWVWTPRTEPRIWPITVRGRGLCGNEYFRTGNTHLWLSVRPFTSLFKECEIKCLCVNHNTISDNPIVEGVTHTIIKLDWLTDGEFYSSLSNQAPAPWWVLVTRGTLLAGADVTLMLLRWQAPEDSAERLTFSLPSLWWMERRKKRKSERNKRMLPCDKLHSGIWIKPQTEENKTKKITRSDSVIVVFILLELDIRWALAEWKHFRSTLSHYWNALISVLLQQNWGKNTRMNRKGDRWNTSRRMRREQVQSFIPEHVLKKQTGEMKRGKAQNDLYLLRMRAPLTWPHALCTQRMQPSTPPIQLCVIRLSVLCQDGG